MKILLSVIFLLLFTSVGLNIFLIGSRQNKEIFKVARVVDGDTFVTTDNKIIRLLGINAPETGLCGSDEAKKYLENLILNKNITFKATTDDVFSRLVADVYVGDVFVNNEMVANGWAAYDSSDSSERERLKSSGQNAREKKLGIFNAKCSQLENLAQPNCVIKGNVNISRNEKTYHLPGCSRYETTSVDLWQGDAWFCSENEAQKVGFVKSKNCFERTYKEI